MVFGILAGLVVAVTVVSLAIEDYRHVCRMRQNFADREAYFKARDPHCDACARDLEKEPQRPVIRCPMHCACVAGLVGDPLFGFDFDKYKEP